MKNSWKQLGLEALLQFIFPKLCLHCQESISSEHHFLCHSCFSLLTLIEPLSSCPRCFSSDYAMGSSSCARCYKHPSFLTAMASSFDYEGPLETLIKKMKYQDKPYLAENLASFMVLQLFNLGWPVPDYIVPVPISKLRLLCRGYNQSLLLANELGRLLNRPVIQALGRRSGDYSQASLGFIQRKQLQEESFYLKTADTLADKKVLLIDDVMTTGSTLRKCAEVLIGSCPQQIYGLTLCRSIY